MRRRAARSSAFCAGLAAVRQPAEREHGQVARRDHVGVVPRSPHLHERGILPGGRHGALHPRMDRQERGPRHAVLQAGPRRPAQRASAPWQPLIERSDAPPERQDLRSRDLQPLSAHVARTVTPDCGSMRRSGSRGVDRVHDTRRRAPARRSARRRRAAGSPAARRARPRLRLPARSRRRARAGERRRLVPAARAGAVRGGRAVHGGDRRGRRPSRARRARLGQGVGRRPFLGRAFRPARRHGVAGAPVRRARRRPARVGGRRTLAGVRRGDPPSNARGGARAGARARCS